MTRFCVTAILFSGGMLKNATYIRLLEVLYILSNPMGTSEAEITSNCLPAWLRLNMFKSCWPLVNLILSITHSPFTDRLMHIACKNDKTWLKSTGVMRQNKLNWLLFMLVSQIIFGSKKLETGPDLMIIKNVSLCGYVLVIVLWWSKTIVRMMKREKRGGKRV